MSARMPKWMEQLLYPRRISNANGELQQKLKQIDYCLKRSREKIESSIAAINGSDDKLFLCLTRDERVCKDADSSV